MTTRIAGVPGCARLWGCALVLLAAGAAAPAAEPFPPPAFRIVDAQFWSVIGPFPASASEADDLARAYPPEATRDFAAQYPGQDGALVCWTQPPTPGPTVKLLPPNAAPGTAVAYAVTYIIAPTAQAVRIACAGDVPLRLWLNGKPVTDWAPPAGVMLDLESGANELLFKARVSGASDGFKLAIAGAGDLRFQPERPWPFVAVPTDTWRMVAAATPADIALARAALVLKDGLGLPDLQPERLAWQVPTVAKDAIVLPAGAAGTHTFVVGHVFVPLKYHSQAYQFRLACEEQPEVWIDGQASAGTWDAARHVFTFQRASHQCRAGLNRMVIVLPGNQAGSLKIEVTHPGDLKFLADVPVSLNPQAHVGDWPMVTLTNGLVTADVTLPDSEKGFYRGNRFEPAGIVTRLEVGGHRFFLSATTPNTPLDNHKCYGPAEEWFEALAYTDAKPGEPFIKMGVGLYEKPYKAHHMWYCEYWPLQRFAWTTKADKDRVEFVQTVAGPRGWGYHYVKRLVVVPGKPVLRIEHELENTGKERISGEQYNHNFLVFDGLPVGKGWRLEFPYPPKPVKDIAKFAEVQNNTVAITASGKDVSGMTDIAGWPAAATEHSFVVSCDQTKTAVRISGDFPVGKLSLFVCPEFIAPEPFIKVSLNPGERKSWTREYEFQVPVP